MDQLNELAKALSAFQTKCGVALNDRTNPAFKSRYATLAAVWDAIRPELSTHGLCVIQLPATSAEGVAVTTTILHTSGQSISSTLTMPIVKRDPQGVGSAMTYARRYGLCAMLGVVGEEDDDGNAASGRGDRNDRQQRVPAKQEQKPDPAIDRPASTAPIAVKGLLKKFAEVFTLDPKAAETKAQFVSFAKDKLHTTIDLAIADNWTDSMVGAIGQELSKVEVAA